MAELLLGRSLAADGESATDTTVATDDLVTHGVIVGMTGSGKTGLGVVLIEECLANGVPTLLIDPKGDLTNLALVFPGLSGPEFEPWVDPAQAKADGTSPAEFAERQATVWREGLAGWGIDSQALTTYKAAFDLAIYTPGSTAGIPMNVLGSLTAPQTDDPEVMADEIEGYVTSLLGVVGIAADPLSSREHILLSNIIHSAWTAGESIDLPTLLARVQQPPMRKLGVFELDQFFPQKDRLAFAMRLNAVLAAPTFQTWITGEPIDIQSMLFSPDGKPRCAVVTTAHLSDEDRQNATSLILSKLVTWMRRQSGTTDLRALLYMDEVAGYLPPSAVPPTKKPIMLLMKQARAFGLGVVLSTQNPVDIDYKALSNAGTWMIGRLTTDRDKARLLEGMSTAAGGVDIGQVSDSISALGKRQFLLRKAGKNEVSAFGTKWARSYLRGPMTRDQIAAIMRPAAAPAPAAPAPAAGEAAAAVAPTQIAPPPEKPAGPPVAAASAAPAPAASAPAPAPEAAGAAAPPAAPAPATEAAPATAPPPAPAESAAPPLVPAAPQAAPVAPPPAATPAPPNVAATAAAAGSTMAPPAPLAADETPVMPSVTGVPVTFLDPAAPWSAQVGAVAPTGSGPRLQAAAAARVHLRYDDTKAGVNHDEEYEAVISPLPAQTASLQPLAVDYDDRDLVAQAPAAARYVLPDAPLDTKTYWTTLNRDLADLLVRGRSVQVFQNAALKLYSRVGETQEQFSARCSEAATTEADKRAAALRMKYQTKLRSLETKLGTAAARAQAADQARASGMLSSVGSVLGGFLSGRRSTSSIGTAARRAQAANEKADVAAAKVGEIQQQINDLDAQLTDEMYQIQSEWQAKAAEVTPVQIPLEKTDVRVVDLKLVWIPVA